MSELTQSIEVETAPNPNAAVIWLHGLGADGRDFEPIVPALGLSADSRIRFIFPNAPVRPVTINNGMQMPAWYDILGLGGQSTEDAAGITASQQTLAALVSSENGRGIGSQRIVLAGFSQGGAVALQTALRYPEPLAGVMALSTYLPLSDTLASEKSAVNADVPILMMHGTNDEMISLDRAKRSASAIESAGFSVQWHEYPMGHEVCMPQVQAIGAWLNEILKEDP